MPGIPKSTEIMRKLLIVMVCLAAVSEAAAQRMPERRSVRRGNRHYAHERFEEAVGQYERALEAAPECFEARYDLGNALYRAGRYDGAEQAMRAAAADTLRSDDERAEAFFNLGDAQFRQEKYREALESYKQSLRLNPADAEAKYNYAYTKRLLEQQEQQQQERNDDSDSGEQSGDGASQQSGGDPQEGGERPDDGDGQKGAEGPEQEARRTGRTTDVATGRRALPARESRRRSRNACSTPSRRRRTARRRSSASARARSCADTGTGKNLRSWNSHHPICFGSCCCCCR